MNIIYIICSKSSEFDKTPLMNFIFKDRQAALKVAHQLNGNVKNRQYIVEEQLVREV